MATKSDALEAMHRARSAYEEDQRRCAAAIDRLMNYWSIPDRVAESYLDQSRATINNKRNGRTLLQPGDDGGFAAFLGVPVEVLRDGPESAMRWVLDHPDTVERATGVYIKSAGQRPFLTPVPVAA